MIRYLLSIAIVLTACWGTTPAAELVGVTVTPHAATARAFGVDADGLREVKWRIEGRGIVIDEKRSRDAIYVAAMSPQVRDDLEKRRKTALARRKRFQRTSPPSKICGTECRAYSPGRSLTRPKAATKLV